MQCLFYSSLHWDMFLLCSSPFMISLIPDDGHAGHIWRGMRIMSHDGIQFQWKPFWLATKLYPQNDWTGWQFCVNYDVCLKASLGGEIFSCGDCTCTNIPLSSFCSQPGSIASAPSVSRVNINWETKRHTSQFIIIIGSMKLSWNINELQEKNYQICVELIDTWGQTGKKGLCSVWKLVVCGQI